MYIRLPVIRCTEGPVLVAIRKEKLNELAKANMMAKVLDANELLLRWGVLSHLTGAFRGVKRPLTVPDSPEWYKPEQIIVCSSVPTCTPRWVDDAPRIDPGPLPDSVFVTYVRKIKDPGQRAQIRHALNADHALVYLAYHWEWVPQDPLNVTLPKEHLTRYDERLPCP